MAPTVLKIRAQRRLATLWLVMAALLTLVLGGNMARFADPTAAWQWFSPYLFPTLLLMVGTLRATETDEAAPAFSSAFYYRLCWSLSFFYGLCLGAALFVSLDDQARDIRPALESLKQKSLLLTSLQSLVSLGLGGFFVASSPKPPAATHPG